MAFLLEGQINWLHVRREGKNTKASCPCDVTTAFAIRVRDSEPCAVGQGCCNGRCPSPLENLFFRMVPENRSQPLCCNKGDRRDVAGNH